VQSETDVVRLLAICVARPGLEAIVQKELLATVPVALTEPGCLEFTLHVDRENPGVFIFYESWVDQAALDRHFSTPHFQALGATFDKILLERPQPRLMRRIA
jgi:quinol monooxygenase YgiN